MSESCSFPEPAGTGTEVRRVSGFLQRRTCSCHVVMWLSLTSRRSLRHLSFPGSSRNLPHARSNTDALPGSRFPAIRRRVNLEIERRPFLSFVLSGCFASEGAVRAGPTSESKLEMAELMREVHMLRAEISAMRRVDGLETSWRLLFCISVPSDLCLSFGSLTRKDRSCES